MENGIFSEFRRNVQLCRRNSLKIKNDHPLKRRMANQNTEEQSF
ncbi:hypothetical protein HMPREF9371_2131 [Neisseria shayeganii 871]|uniref:Uncharacterized protein n=1 Tax=Neisseria shayeganii 871 TaxID=1032488 RepID=G4CKJ1_9NEIS|nr:hypothetical protein HMPREF9371_2131 [Neisseria shayeganii 871]